MYLSLSIENENFLYSARQYWVLETGLDALETVFEFHFNTVMNKTEALVGLLRNWTLK
jgi:hypothetical protein